MSDPAIRKRSGLQSPRARWAALGGIVVLILGAVMAPRRAEFVVPVDGSARWRPDEAPLRREIVWSPAEELPLPPPADATGFITPRFAEDGTALFFTVRTESSSTDIFVTRRENDGWGVPTAVIDINSAAEDLAPVLSRDGARLYFASNRPGGLGGFDLYVAERTGQGWSAARNLGPAVNSAADEYDPAPNADGTALYFATNRELTDESTGRSTEQGGAAPPAWSATLRAQRGTFDLFVAERAEEGLDWQAARPLEGVNRPDSHEGGPCVSPNGVFLYFASDRAVRPGEPRNLDLFRVRLDLPESEPENLGPGVNTAAHETEPGLSPEGFTLVFASDRGGADRLYASSAEEVLIETEWRTARLPAVSPFAWKVLFTALLLSGLIASILLYRRRLTEYFAASRYVLGSIAVHALLLVLLAIWNLPRVLEVIVSRKFDAIPSTQLFDDNQHQSHEEGQAAYEKLADLQALEPAPEPEIARQEAEPLNVPRRTDDPLPTIPLEAALRRPAREVLRVAPAALPDQPRERLPSLPAGRSTANALAVALPEPDLELPPPAELTPESVIAGAEVAAPRTPLLNPAPTADDDSRAAALPVPRVELAAPASVTSAVPERSPSLPVNPLETRALPNMPLNVVELDTALQLPTSPAPVAEAPLAAAAPVEMARSRPVAPFPDSASASHLPPTEVPKPHTVAEVDLELPIRDSAVSRLPTVPGRLQASTAPPASALAAIPDETTIESPERPAEPADPLREPIGLAMERPASPVSLPLTPDQMSGPARRPDRPLIVGAPDVESNRAPPDFGPIVTRLNRAPARAAPVAIAVDSVGLRSMFTLRQADTRRQYIQLFGGTDASEQAVNRGLEWLAAHQNPDGSWSLNRFHENCQHPACSGAGSESSNTAATGLALLPFLAAGHTHQAGEYQSVVAGGIRWLLEHQQESGDLLAPGDGQQMYSHGIAAIALCEAYGMTRDPELQGPAQASADFIVAAQHDSSGGWRYKPEEHGDTSVVGWQVMALKSAEMAGLIVPASTHAGALRWLESVEGNQPTGGQFGYQNRNSIPAMTAEGLLCLQFLGVDRNDPAMRAGADYLLTQLPEPTQRHTSYYWYYGTQVVYHMQGDYFVQWNEAIRDLVVETQIKDGPLAGTWDPRDQWEHRGGRLYATSLKLLVLEIYYRHLPLYEQLGE